MLYLDNSATTKLLPEVLETMLPYLKEEYGNPSSKFYSLAENAKKAVDHSRQQVANLLNCRPDEVIFTGGATESNNLIIKGVTDYYASKGNHIVTTKAEHASVMETCLYLETKGYRITYLDVDKYGRVNPDQLETICQKDKPILVSVIWGNNELGSLNPINKLAEICQKHDVFFHTDATQVIGKIPINMATSPGIQFLSCSAHKLHGPKGTGAAIIRKHRLGFKTKITPLMHGGGQEDGYRSGTSAVHNIVGFGKAAELQAISLNQSASTLQKREAECRALLEDIFGDIIVFNSDTSCKLPGVLNFQLLGTNNELFIKKIAKDIAISTGSACSSDQPSHVLQAIGLTLEAIRCSYRISLDLSFKEDDLDVLRNVLTSVYAK